MKSVLVLLSTYNGYLVQQLNSIENQTGVKVHCLIRDDGSTDGTLNILESYCKNRSNFTLIRGDNIGVINSFNELLTNSMVNQYEWFAFCDQDDEWKPDKLINAIKMLERYNDSSPNVYCSNLTLVDRNSKYLGMMRNSRPSFDKYTALVQNCATGCTEVFNKAAVELYLKATGKRMEMHDYWMFLIAVYFGNLIYDDNSYIKYRQHDSNVVGAHKRTVRGFIYNIRKKQRDKRADMLIDFFETYNFLLSNDDKKIIQDLLNCRNNKRSRIRVIANKKYHGYTSKNTLAFRFRVILGIIH